MFRRHKHLNLLRARALFCKKSADAAGKKLSAAAVGLIFSVAAVVLVVLPFGFIALRVYSLASSGRNAVTAAVSAAESFDLATALTRTEEAAVDFQGARNELAKLRLLDAVPYVARKTEAADALLGAGSTAVEALRQTLLVAKDIIGTVQTTSGLSGASWSDAASLFRGLKAEQKRDILAGFAAAAPRIRTAVRQIDAAAVAFDSLPDDPSLQGVKAALQPMRSRLAEMSSRLETALPLTEILPAALGYPEAKHYLFFFQNDAELRPTGGFLSMVGTFAVKDAELAAVEVGDVYALDGPSEAGPRPAPPEPIRKYINISKWYLRDANWSPDFPTAAGVMEQFYREEYAAAHGGQASPPIDGIIAVTPRLAEDLLRLTGPITVDGRRFDADNLVDELEFQVEKGYVGAGISADQRKNIVGHLFDEMTKRVVAFPLTKMLAVAGAAERALTRGDILLSFKEPSLRQLVLANDWGGRLQDVRGDYLAVIDANLASLKSDSRVTRSVKYNLAPAAGGGYVGKVTVTYENHGSFTWKTTRYRTYTRVYVPAGTELIGVAGAMENDKLKDPAGHPGKPDVGDELGRRYFGAFISVEPGRQGTLEFTFKLAPAVAREIAAGTYSLDIDKQAGTVGRGLTLELDFGKNLTSAVPAETAGEFGDSRYRYVTDLDVDRHFEARLQP